MIQSKTKTILCVDLQREQLELERLLKCEHAPLSNDNNNRKEVRLYDMQMKLDRHLQDLRDQLRQRQSLIRDLLDQEQQLCNVLVIESGKQITYDPLPSAGDLREFEEYLRQLRCEIEIRSTAFDDLRDSIRLLADEMEVESKQDFRFGILRNDDLPLSKANLSMLQKLHSSLIDERSELQRNVEVRLRKLTELYACLGMSATPMTMAAFQRVTQSGLEALTGEIQRCEKIKRANIQTVVENVRAQIKEFWTKTLKSDREIARFVHFTSDTYNDDLLALHEMELSDLKQFYDDNV